MKIQTILNNCSNAMKLIATINLILYQLIKIKYILTIINHLKSYFVLDTKKKKCILFFLVRIYIAKTNIVRLIEINMLFTYQNSLNRMLKFMNKNKMIDNIYVHNQTVVTNLFCSN
jgi:hypothetical protein